LGIKLKKIRQHLNAKVFIITTTLLMSISLITYLFIFFTAPKSYLTEINTSVDRAAQNLVSYLSNADKDECITLLENFAEEHNISYEVYDKKGNLLNFSATSIQPAPNQEAQELAKKTHTIKQYKFRLEDSQEEFTLKVLGTQERVNLFANTLKKNLPFITLLVFLISILISYFYSKFITTPILRISDLSKKLASLDFSVNFSNNRNDEIGVLSDNLDDLSNQLSSALEDLKIANKKLKEDVEKEKQLEQQQLSFFSAVSHELKTPITILKGQLQGMIYNVGGYKDRDKYLQKSYQVTERMENLVQEILSISKMKNSTFDLSLNKTGMAQLLYSCINENNELAIQHNIEIIEQIDNSIFVNVDSSLMKKALNNIIHNAIVYSPDENVVQIKLHKIQDKIILDIENTGAHIDEHEISELFLPFTRHEKSRNRNTGGSGLGLYLVKMILDLHKMPFTMKNTKRGILFSICMERDCMK